jgi:hypothetical protein
MSFAKRMLAPSLLCALSACTDVPDTIGPSEPFRPSLSVSAASAPVVYTNFGPSMTFDTNHGWTINGFLGPTIGQQAISQQFTPAISTRFGGAQVALGLYSGPGVVDVYLQEDLDGLPGAVIEKIPLAGLTPTPSIFTATSTLMPPLSKDVPYWLTVVAGAAGVLAGWNWNSIGDASATTFASTQGGGPSGPWGVGLTETRAAFQINGPPTPQALVSAVIGKIQALVIEGVLTQGQAQGLIATLTAVVRSLDSGRTVPACNQLSAFLAHVHAFVVSGVLDAVTGQELTTSGESVHGVIGC